MHSPRWLSFQRTTVVASLLSVAMIVAVPVRIDLGTGKLFMQVVLANGNGHGGGNGHGNANGGGHGNANGGGNASNGSASANAASAGEGDDEAIDGEGDSAGLSNGSVASSLGALNAAHASPTALNNAAPNSRVGKIAAVKEAGTVVNEVNAAENVVNDPNATPEARAQAQAFLDSVDPVDPVGVAAENQRTAVEAASNKTVTDQVIDSVRDLLGLN